MYRYVWLEMDGQNILLTDGWMDGWTEYPSDRWVDGWMDRISF